jgi:Uma2 family endonuclease
MASSLQHLRMSEDAYFEMLEKSVHKYEYWDGVAVAMAGAQPDHVLIQGNVFGELFQKLRGKLCRPLGSDQAVKLAASRGYVFPDVTVVCGKPEYVVTRGIGCLLNPTVVVEVLSPTTAGLDDNEKLLAYTGIRTVREYLVISTNSIAATLFFRRSADETWSLRLYHLSGDVISLESCGCDLAISEIYAGVNPDDFRPESTQAV